MIEKIIKEGNEWKYEIKEGEVSILSYLGEDMEVEVPKKIEGLPVVALEKHAFYEKKSLNRVSLPSTICRMGEYAFSECRALCEIEIPASLIKISRHAFYNCRKLERVILWDTVRDIEDGAFKNCYELREIKLFLKTRKNTALNQILYDSKNKMTVELWRDDIVAKLEIPEYALDSQIDINSRAFHEVIHGMGSVFRDWVSFQYMDFDKYDALFDAMVREEKMEDVINMAFGRLRYPFELSQKNKEKYESYMKENMREVLKVFIKDYKKDAFSWLLTSFAGIEKNIIDECIDMTIKEGQNEFTVLLMAYRRKNYRKKEKSFDL
ncbi:MAG: leucine-rich repeat domain-containing protein [Lachnospiraceae bacterium]